MHTNRGMPSGRRSTSPLLIGLFVLGCAAHSPAMAIAACSPTMTDAQITDAVGDALFTKHGVPGYVIDVRTNEGIVTMSGTVYNIMAKERAVRVAETVKGVRSVVERTKVADTRRSDNEVRDDVQDELYWSPFVDSDEVTVMVDDGVATLTGVVDTWNERQAATENAYEGGAIAVDNDLRVHYGPDYYEP
jgi:osmotically-inducible protein OsmY